MKKLLLYLAIIFFTYSCGSKRVIYNNQNDKPKKEKKVKRSKPKNKKVKKVVLAPRISNIEDYVKVYSEIAMDEMIQFGIPASITLSQGILESGIGKGRLAVEANNHFGIKCHDWNGKKIYHDDDEEQECFRKYDNIVLKKKNKKYKVRRGDTLYSISEKFNMPVEALVKLNNLNGDILKVGQILMIKK